MYWCRLQHGWKYYDVEWRKLVTKTHILYDPIGILPIGIIPLVDSVHTGRLVVAWGWGRGENRRWLLTEWSFFLQWWEYSEIRQWWELHCSMLCSVLSRSVRSNSLWPHGCSPPGSLSLGILQAKILKWAAMPSSRGSSQPRDWIQVSHIASRFFTVWATREAPGWPGKSQFQVS